MCIPRKENPYENFDMPVHKRVESTQLVPFENALLSMQVHGTGFHKGYEKDVHCGFYPLFSSIVNYIL